MISQSYRIEWLTGGLLNFSRARDLSGLWTITQDCMAFRSANQIPPVSA
jgi:hypothetical protein